MSSLTPSIDSSRDVPERAFSAALVFLIAFVWLAVLAGLRPLALPDEGRYVGVALEMLRSGDWLTPTLNGLPFFHKPPLFYWLTAASLHLFGMSEWASRCASIAAASWVVALLYSSVREWLGVRLAGMVALVLVTQPLFFGASQFANLDMLVAGCISSSILFGARAAMHWEASAPHRRDLAAAYAAAAFGVLAKGLIGAVLPLLVLGTWLVLRRRWRTMYAMCWLPGIALFLVVVAPWCVAMEVIHPGFFHYFFVVQHVQRFAGSGFNNAQPVWFYVPVLTLLLFPWSAWLLPNLRRANTLTTARVDVLWLMCSWLGVVIIFFSIPESKLVGYVLPSLPPLAVVMAMTASGLIDKSTRALRLWKLSIGVAAAMCIAGIVALTIWGTSSSRGVAAELTRLRVPTDGLAMIDHYDYDLPFYLRDAAPTVVVSNWDAAEIEKKDNWRKELFEAGAFAPALAARLLVGPAQFKALMCTGRIKWVVATVAEARPYPVLVPTGASPPPAHEPVVWRVQLPATGSASASFCDRG